MDPVSAERRGDHDAVHAERVHARGCGTAESVEPVGESYPGEKISWDQHLHAVGEEITVGSEIGIWLYPKGQEPRKRSYLVGFTGLRKREFVDIPPNSVSPTEGFTVLRENTLITNFQPHFHLRGKAMQVEAILPDGSNQIVSYVGKFNFNWMTKLHL